MHCVFFFGSYDYGWLPESDLKPYKEFKSKMNTTKKSIQKAIDEIESYIEGGCKTNAATIVATSKAADKATPSKKTPKKEKSSNDTSKLDASSNEDDEDAEFDALFSESKTPASVGKKRNKSAEGNNGEADGSSKPKKAKTPTAKKSS